MVKNKHNFKESSLDLAHLMTFSISKESDLSCSPEFFLLFKTGHKVWSVHSQGYKAPPWLCLELESFSLLKNKLRHFKHSKSLFEQKSIGIRTALIGSGSGRSANRCLELRKDWYREASKERKLWIDYVGKLSGCLWWLLVLRFNSISLKHLQAAGLGLLMRLLRH